MKWQVKNYVRIEKYVNKIEKKEKQMFCGCVMIDTSKWDKVLVATV